MVVAVNYSVSKTKPGVTEAFDAWLFKDNNNTRGLQ
jgi:hypothetical protein